MIKHIIGIEKYSRNIKCMNYNSGNETFNFIEMVQELLNPLQIISNREMQLIIISVHYCYTN
jgi:hypothetical protein